MKINWASEETGFSPMYCFLVINPLVTRDPLIGAFSNNEDPDEMPQNVSFHQGLHC